MKNLVISLSVLLLATGYCVRTANAAPPDIVLEGHTDTVRSAAFSPDGTKIVTASEDNTARIWDAATGKELQKLEGHTHYVWSAVFSPDGKRIVTA
ncbi:MAG: hypothetical protein LBT46_00250, partial [Planctomycetaceae bacterium]|nr:hypothetical protein [Planctomycetaceae bacterium]